MAFAGFKRVPPVRAGKRITSADLVNMAEAANSRLRPNLGDGVERLVAWMFYLFRLPRNPADESTFPSQAEFFEDYQQLKATSGTWPTAAAGDPEGARLANFMNAFVFGLADLGLDSEDVRIADPGANGVPLFID